MMVIPRKPVGLGPSNSVKHVKEHSLASSSIYSEPAELDVPKTNISEYSLESVQLDDNIAPQLPPKELPPVPSKDEFGKSVVPPIPPKDAARQESSVSTFRLADGNFQKPEIWKRRSDRSNSEISFEDLKLSKSNGSTAGSPPRAQPPQRSLPPIPSDTSKGKSVLRKTRSPPPRPPPQPDYMGSKNSKLKKKESHGSVSPSHLPGRLPTPEYQKSDRQIPETPNILSPVSPESPESPELSPAQRSPVKKLSSIFKPKSSPAIPQVHLHQSTDSTFSNVQSRSRSSSDTLTIVGPTDSTIFSMPQPQKANATARILTPQPSPPTEVTQSRSPPPQQGTPKSPRSPFYFPFSPAQKAAAIANKDVCRDPPAIDESHYKCFQQHRFMRPSRNDKCPVACMTCKKMDLEKRWCCTWCCLRVCTSCIEILSSSGKDLRLSMERIGNSSVGVGQAR